MPAQSGLEEHGWSSGLAITDSISSDVNCAGGRADRARTSVFDLLVYLVRNRDRVVSRGDLIDIVWGGRIVSDSALTRA
jgi:DNA-binding response OmpR family regulator